MGIAENAINTCDNPLKKRKFRTDDSRIITSKIYFWIPYIVTIGKQISGDHGGYCLSPIMTNFKWWICNAYELNAKKNQQQSMNAVELF